MNYINLINSEEEKISKSTNSNEKYNLIYNLIRIKNNENFKTDNYKDIKRFFEFYIEDIKISSFGYDNINFDKINELINLLTPEEQSQIIRHFQSLINRELPEFEKDWFIEKKHNIEIDIIISNKKYWYYPKILLLYTSLNVRRLLLFLLVLFGTIYVILLPSPLKSMEMFKLEYENYDDNFYLNHFFNILSMLVDIENSFKILPLNWFSLILIIISKLLFVIIFLNFIYRKISDKLTI